MPITVTTESVQHNFYQLVRQLIAGDQDKVIATDAGANLFQMVTYAVYDAADPGGAAGATEDIVAAYSGLPSVYKAPLYRLIKRMRDRQAGVDAQAASGSIALPAAGGSAISDTEDFTLTNTAATATVFEFDSGGGITGDVAITYTGAETDVAIAALMETAINTAAVNITAAAGSTFASGSLAVPATGGAAFLDTETFILTNAAGAATTFEFDLAGGGATGTPIVYTGAENQAAMAVLIQNAINTAAIDITAVASATAVSVTQDTAGGAGNVTITETVADAGFVATGFAGGTASVALTQGDPGTTGNVTITDTVADVGFVPTGFAGGTDVGATGGVITLKNSKNDTDPVIVMVPEDHAVAIGL